MLNKKNSCANVFYQNCKPLESTYHNVSTQSKISSLKQDKSSNSLLHNEYQLDKKQQDTNMSQYEHFQQYSDYYNTMQYNIGSPKIEPNNKENVNNLTGSSGQRFGLERPLKSTLENAINKAINQSEKLVSPKTSNTAKATPQSSGKKNNQSYYISNKLQYQQSQQQQHKKLTQHYQNQSQQHIHQSENKKSKTPIRSRSPISTTVDLMKKNVASKSQIKNPIPELPLQSKQSGHQACKISNNDSRYNSNKKEQDMAVFVEQSSCSTATNKIQRNTTSTSVYSKRQTVTNNISNDCCNHSQLNNNIITKCEKKQQISIIPAFEQQNYEPLSIIGNSGQSLYNNNNGQTCGDQIYRNPAFVESIITNKDTLQFLKRNFLERKKNSMNCKCQCLQIVQGQQVTQISQCENCSEQLIIVGGSWNTLSLDRFVILLFQEFPEVLQDHSINEQIIDELKQKVKVCLKSEESINALSLQKLQYYTKTTGLLGLILRALKEFTEEEKHKAEVVRSSFAQIADSTKACFMKSLEEKDIAFLFKQNDVQNIMNILQEFMESMFREMETEVYTKFNTEMRRMVLKFRQTEKLLQIVNEKVTDNFDLFQQEAQNNAIIRDLKAQNEQLNEQIHKLNLDAVLKQTQLDSLTKEKERMQKEYEKLNERCELFQNKILLTNSSSTSNILPSTSNLPQQQQQNQKQNQQQQTAQIPSPRQATLESMSENKAVVYPRYAQININSQNTASNAFSGIMVLDNTEQVISPLRKFETNQAMSPFKMNKQVESNCSSIINFSLSLLEELRLFTSEQFPTSQGGMRGNLSLFEFQQNCQSQNSQAILSKKVYRPLNFFMNNICCVFTSFIEMFPLLRNPRIVSLEEIKIFLDFFYRISLFLYENKYNNALSKVLKNYEENRSFKVCKLPIIKCWNKIFCENNARHLVGGVPGCASNNSNTGSECGQFPKLVDDKLSGISSGLSSRQSSIINNNINNNFNDMSNPCTLNFTNQNQTTLANANKKLDASKNELIISNEMLTNEIILILKDIMLSIDKKFNSEIQQTEAQQSQLGYMQQNSSMCENFQIQNKPQKGQQVEHHKKNQSNTSNCSAVFKYQKKKALARDQNEESILQTKLKLYTDFLILMHSVKLNDTCYAMQEMIIDYKIEKQQFKNSISNEINEFILDNEIIMLIFICLKKWQYDASLCEFCMDFLSGFKFSGQTYLEFVKQLSQPFIIECLIDVLESGQKKEVEKQCINFVKTISYSISLQGQESEKLKLMFNKLSTKYHQSSDNELSSSINMILKNISPQQMQQQ